MSEGSMKCSLYCPLLALRHLASATDVPSDVLVSVAAATTAAETVSASVALENLLHSEYVAGQGDAGQVVPLGMMENVYIMDSHEDLVYTMCVDQLQIISDTVQRVPFMSREDLLDMDLMNRTVRREYTGRSKYKMTTFWSAVRITPPAIMGERSVDVVAEDVSGADGDGEHREPDRATTEAREGDVRGD